MGRLGERGEFEEGVGFFNYRFKGIRVFWYWRLVIGWFLEREVLWGW